MGGAVDRTETPTFGVVIREIRHDNDHVADVRRIKGEQHGDRTLLSAHSRRFFG